jgi:hypothetical protein
VVGYLHVQQLVHDDLCPEGCGLPQESVVERDPASSAVRLREWR